MTGIMAVWSKILDKQKVGEKKDQKGILIPLVVEKEMIYCLKEERTLEMRLTYKLLPQREVKVGHLKQYTPHQVDQVFPNVSQFPFNTHICIFNLVQLHI